MRARVGRSARAIAAALLAATTGCASPPPTAWGPDFPRRGDDLATTLAGLRAPAVPERMHVEVQRLRIFDLADLPWSEIRLADLEQGRFRIAPDGEYALVARSACVWWTGRQDVPGKAVSWYYFVDDALFAYEHVDFEAFCRHVPRIRGVAPGSELRSTMPALMERPPPPR